MQYWQNWINNHKSSISCFHVRQEYCMYTHSHSPNLLSTYHCIMGHKGLYLMCFGNNLKSSVFLKKRKQNPWKTSESTWRSGHILEIFWAVVVVKILKMTELSGVGKSEHFSCWLDAKNLKVSGLRSLDWQFIHFS